MRKIVMIGLILAALLASCNSSDSLDAPDPTPSAEILADTFFSGCAYLDQDGDEAIDPGEPLLGGLTFTITLASGAGFGDETSAGHCAFIVVPSALPADAWPIVARMTADEGLNYKPIGSSTATLEFPQIRAEFLFEAE